MAQAHQVEIQTLRGWVKKYRELSIAGLEDRRGRWLAGQMPRSRDEALRIENARLKQENELLKMELYLRKKGGTGKGGPLRQFWQEQQYEAVCRGTEEKGFSISATCRELHVSQTCYY